METAYSLRRRLTTLGAVFIAVWVARWLSVLGLGGDDHWSLWSATAFLAGDAWFDGFVDMGFPLYWMVSAAAQT